MERKARAKPTTCRRSWLMGAVMVAMSWTVVGITDKDCRPGAQDEREDEEEVDDDILQLQWLRLPPEACGCACPWPEGAASGCVLPPHRVPVSALLPPFLPDPLVLPATDGAAPPAEENGTGGGDGGRSTGKVSDTECRQSPTVLRLARLLAPQAEGAEASAVIALAAALPSPANGFLGLPPVEFRAALRSADLASRFGSAGEDVETCLCEAFFARRRACGTWTSSSGGHVSLEIPR